MRGLTRFLFAVVFLVLFPLFLITHAVRTTLLSEPFWQQTIKPSGISQEVITNIEKLQQGLRTGDAPPTEEEVDLVIGQNINRIVGYITGSEKKLLLALDLDKLKVPRLIRSSSMLSSFSENTDVETLIPYFIQDPKQQTTILDALRTVQIAGSLTPILWFISLIGMIGSLIGLFFLGGNLRSKLQVTAAVVFVAGLTSVIAAFAGASAVTGIVASTTGFPVWLTGILKGVSEGFFVPGKWWGAATAVLGFVGLLLVGRLPEEKVVSKKTTTTHGKKAFIIAGAIVLLILVVLAFKSGALEFSATVSKNGVSTQSGDSKLADVQKLIDEPYDTGFGWSIRHPQGWEITKSDAQQTAAFSRRINVKQNPADKNKWALLAGQPQPRSEPVDNEGELIGILTDIISKDGMQGAKNAEMVTEPTEDNWNGFKRFTIVYDYDSEQNNLRIRELRWYLYPVSGGDGFLLYSQMEPTEGWNYYHKLLEEAMDTFALSK